LRAWLIRG